MKTDNLTSFKKNTITVCFHIGRDKHGKKQVGCKTYNKFVSTFRDCFSIDDTLICTDIDDNPLPDDEWRLVDRGGNTILKGKDNISSDIGVLERDTLYDTDIVQYIEDCSFLEMEILHQACIEGDVDDESIKDYVAEYYGEKHINHIRRYGDKLSLFYQSGNIEIELFDNSPISEYKMKERLKTMGFWPDDVDEILHFINMEWGFDE